MVKFKDKDYQLFFSNNLEPLRALNYADEYFFNEFERLCGGRYRILSVIRNGWQEKYGLQSDIDILQKQFEKILKQDEWCTDILKEYESQKEILEASLNEESMRDYALLKSNDLFLILLKIRKQSATLDAMSNLLHLFSSLIGGEFLGYLKNYSEDEETVNHNFIFYTQPIKESKYAKLVSSEPQDKFTLSQVDQNLSSILRTGAYIKDDVSALLEDRGTKLSSLFTEIAKRISIDLNDLFYLTVLEIENALVSQKNVTKLFKERKNITVLFYSEKHLEVIAGEKAEVFLKKGKFSEVTRTFDENNELKGQVASLGKVSGRAVVVKNSEEAIKFVEEGDILIAPYTAPEYLPAMKKAVAIVTETGGITSHAAIVSRELKIPCVIGVSDVVSILKTGDQIEVNADVGTISILKRSA